MRSIRELIASFGSTEQVEQSGSPDYRRIARSKRKKLIKAWNLRSMPKKKRVGHERTIEKHARAIIKKSRADRRLTQQEQMLLIRKMRPSPLLDHLYPERSLQGRWKDLKDRQLTDDQTTIELENFSFFSEPNATMEGLRRLAEAEANAPGAQINFHDEYCLDVVPFMLLAECWNEMLPVFEGGKMSVPMQKVLSAVGIEYALGIRLPDVREFSDLWAFPLARRRKAGSTSSTTPYLDVQSRELAADYFCDAIDEWLGRPEIKLELNQNGTAWIKGLLGELLENAERHSDGDRRDGSWAVSGFMARRKQQDSETWHYRAHIGIVSIGDTFEKSLSRALPEVRDQMHQYIRRMKAQSAPQSQETLKTLIALQDGVTCAADADTAGRGGYGLQDMLDLVNLLGGTSYGDHQPRVTIISGSSCIMLRTPYIRGKRTEGPNGPRVLWCNENNSNKEVPDESYVFDLSPGLPGTAISIGFILDPEYFNRLTNVSNRNDQNRSS